jgi:hypothetical protein
LILVVDRGCYFKELPFLYAKVHKPVQPGSPPKSEYDIPTLGDLHPSEYESEYEEDVQEWTVDDIAYRK